MKKLISLILSVIMLLGASSLLACSKKFTVTFDPNGGQQVEGDTASLVQTVSSAEELVAPKFEKEGYDFNGWDLSLLDITEDATVKAQWKKQTFIVTFNGGGGERAADDTTPLTQTVSSADELVEPTFVKEGYTFNGWSVDLSAITEATTVIALWKANTYQLSFNANGGTWDSGFSNDYKVTATYGEKINANAMPTATLTNKKFEKWVIVDSDEALNGKAFSPSVEYSYTKDLALKISWIAADAFTITYENTEIGELKTSFYVDDQAFELGQPTKKGYNFIGWTGEGITTPNKNVTITPSTVTDDLTYTANWEAKTFTVTLKNDGSNYGDPINATYGNLVGELPTPTKTDYSFEGWEYNGVIFLGGDNGATKWEIDAGDIELTAVWKRANYSIVLNKTYYDSSRNRTVTVVVKDASSQEVSGGELSIGQKLNTVTSALSVTFVNAVDEQDYEFSYWAYKSGNNYVKITDSTQVSDDIAVDGVITLYPVCYWPWIGPY